MLLLAKELGKIEQRQADQLCSQSEEISKILSGFIKTL